MSILSILYVLFHGQKCIKIYFIFMFHNIVILLFIVLWQYGSVIPIPAISIEIVYSI